MDKKPENPCKDNNTKTISDKILNISSHTVNFYITPLALYSLLDFVKFTHKFQQIKRIIYVNGEDRNENDAEHSFQLALVAWYIIESKQLELDIDKVIKYSLVHDLVETYAGDTYFFRKDTQQQKSKTRKEALALQRIKKEFPELKELPDLIIKYEAKADKESQFVYALDKMLPVLNIYLDKGRSWKREKVTYEMIRTKDEKIAVAPDLVNMWKEFADVLEKNKDKLFYKDK